LAGDPGAPPDVTELEAAVQKATKYVTKSTESVTDISLRLEVLEEKLSQSKIEIDSEHKQVETYLKDIKIEVDEEITEISEETCRADFSAKASPCCPDCNKASFRVPSEKQCKDEGCEHSCAYMNMTCDDNGDRLDRPCLFPFTIGEKRYDSCTTDSPFGQVERPWCFLDTAQNRIAMAQEEELTDVGFCDCTDLRCTCPKGFRLGEDNKSCVPVGQNAALVHSKSRSAEGHHHRHHHSHHKRRPDEREA